MTFRPEPRSLAAWTLLGLGSITAVKLASAFVASDLGDALTRNMIRLALAWYATALALMMFLRNDDWRAATRLGRAARWCWTWGVAAFVIHVLLAFHFFHHWSQAAALQHTREVSGVAEGLYVSYLFTGLWIADAACWWLAPHRYAARAPWIDRLLHGFMLFMVFNSTVIFESGPIRWVSLVALAALAALWLVTRAKPLTPCASERAAMSTSEERA